MNKEEILNFIEWVQWRGAEVSIVFFEEDFAQSGSYKVRGITRAEAEKLVDIYLEFEEKRK